MSIYLFIKERKVVINETTLKGPLIHQWGNGDVLGLCQTRTSAARAAARDKLVNKHKDPREVDSKC
jgi:hypothetical protein